MFKSDVAFEAKNEKCQLQLLRTGLTSHVGEPYAARYLDDFEIEGPNGCHTCLVMEASGTHMKGFWKGLWELSPKAEWEVSKLLVEGISYMHGLGVVHGGA